MNLGEFEQNRLEIIDHAAKFGSEDYIPARPWRNDNHNWTGYDFYDIRLDWEVEEENFKEEGFSESVVSLMTIQFKHDIFDLLINGDVDSDDPLYKILNGSKKRGTDYKDIAIVDFFVVAKHKPKKNTYEIPVQSRIAVKW